MSNFRRRLMKSLKNKEYTELEYIESTGTQYINTNCLPNASTKIKFDFQYTDFSVNLQQYNGASFHNGQYFFWGAFNKSNPIFLCNFNKENTSIYFSNYDTNRHIMWLEGGKQELDKIVYGTKQMDGNYSSTQYIFLFACNVNWHDPSHYFHCYEKVYSCEIYDSDILVRNFIPVLDKNGVPCLYDKVEDKFYYNEGTGEFLYE